MLLRYALLVALAAASIWAVVNVGASQSQMFLVDAGQGGAMPKHELAYWLLAGIATLIALSLCRFVIFGLPAMLDDWYRNNKSWLYALVFGVLLYGVLYLM